MSTDLGITFDKHSLINQKTTLTADLALKALRAAVVLTKDAVNAVSVTAMDALREALALINIKDESELIDPFMHLDAPIWEHKPGSKRYNEVLESMKLDPKSGMYSSVLADTVSYRPGPNMTGKDITHFAIPKDKSTPTKIQNKWSENKCQNNKDQYGTTHISK